MKQFVGGFRPYYIEACNPDMSLLYKDTFHDRYWFNVTACTGKQYEIKKAYVSYCL